MSARTPPPPADASDAVVPATTPAVAAARETGGEAAKSGAGPGRPARSRPTRAERLRRSLEEEIFQGRLKPGDRLDEISLARRFNVSRTPVREALRQLSSSGLVEVRPRLGAVVRVITVDRLAEMFEVMAELEALCARLAAQRMGPDEHAALEQALAACAVEHTQANREAYYEANKVFHDIIYAGAHNAYLAGMAVSLRNQTAPYRRYQLYAREDRIDSSLAEHRSVVMAILEGRAEDAEKAMRAHVTVQGDVFAAFLATLPEEAAQ
ncbi:GntR family transcriptional regulator [Roseospirillum parvum]|uniref:GntR family transcriptional regulator n=1 Tax=Roseospirillum parvum TaxID=83401 RepID=UPI001FE02DD8|nr:GntR family transcriptional regulator [Roseospirillum parvum]